MSPTRQTNNVPKWVVLSFQVRVFYAVRIFLGILSVITDAALVVALSRKYGKRLACYALAMLCLTSGCFFASTSEYAYSLCYGYPHCSHCVAVEYARASSLEPIIIFFSMVHVHLTATINFFLSADHSYPLSTYFFFVGFLPSSFSMYAISLSSALFLFEKPAMAVAVAAAGVILGWPFSVLAFLPITICSLTRRFKQSFLAGAITSIVALVIFFINPYFFSQEFMPMFLQWKFMGVYQSFQKSLNNVLDFFQALSLVVDYTYYGRWTSSVLNLLIYNVLGGGESHLYGTEGPLYYLKNGFNNFNFCFILALLFVGVLPFARKKYAPDLFLVVSPIYIWLAFMSLQPHKEERLDLFRHSIYFPAV